MLPKFLSQIIKRKVHNKFWWPSVYPKHYVSMWLTKMKHDTINDKCQTKLSLKLSIGGQKQYCQLLDMSSHHQFHIVSPAWKYSIICFTETVCE